MVKMNLKGSSMIEMLIGLVIITTIFGLTISFFSNRNHAKNITDCKNLLEVKRFKSPSKLIVSDADFETESFLLRDSLCEIVLIKKDSDSLGENTLLMVNPIQK